MSGTESVPARRKPPGRARDPDKKSRIVREAAALFDRSGYHSTSMDDIAQAVGVSKPTLYHHFRSKDDILFSIHEEVIEFNIAQEERRNALGMSAAQQLLELLTDVIELNMTRPGYVRVFFEHYRELPAEQQVEIQEKRDRYRDLVEGVIARGVETGEFRPLEPRLATLFLVGASNWAYQWFRPDGPRTAREIAYAFWDYFIRGATAPSA
jgi:TetR/AcrR family transcriptional regulator, cholesterol catabolism regulator